MRIGYVDANDCNFTIVIKDNSKQDKAVECIKKGIEAWYAATDPGAYDGNEFTKDEVANFYWEGYAVPTCKLLEREGIEYELVDDEYYDDGRRVFDRLVNGF